MDTPPARSPPPPPPLSPSPSLALLCFATRSRPCVSCGPGPWPERSRAARCGRRPRGARAQNPALRGAGTPASEPLSRGWGEACGTGQTTSPARSQGHVAGPGRRLSLADSGPRTTAPPHTDGGPGRLCSRRHAMRGVGGVCTTPCCPEHRRFPSDTPRRRGECQTFGLRVEFRGLSGVPGASRTPHL